MNGYCENCAKCETCRKDIGIIWGFCNTDFEPKGGNHEKERNDECGRDGLA